MIKRKALEEWPMDTDGGRLVAFFDNLTAIKWNSNPLYGMRLWQSYYLILKESIADVSNLI